MGTATLRITTDKTLINTDYVFHYLNEISYWAKGIPRNLVEKSIQNSLCFVPMLEDKQVGFARLVTDFATYAYLADVFIDPNHRAKGYAKQLMQFIVDYPELQAIRRWGLLTGDAHGLYQQFGFTSPTNPEMVMERVKQNPYG